MTNYRELTIALIRGCTEQEALNMYSPLDTFVGLNQEHKDLALRYCKCMERNEAAAKREGTRHRKRARTA